jgi:hypothetical protein
VDLRPADGLFAEDFGFSEELGAVAEFILLLGDFVDSAATPTATESKKTNARNV